MWLGRSFYFEFLLLSLVVVAARWVWKQVRRAKKKIDVNATMVEIEKKEAIAVAQRGGSPDNPFVVDSSAVIDSRAKRQPCPLCGGRLNFEEQVVDRYQGKLLRCTHLACIDCRVKRRFWFEIVPSAS